MARKKAVQDFGFTNDVDFQISKVINGKLWVDPIYTMWINMKRRVIYQYKVGTSEETLEYLTYVGNTVCEEWRFLSNFYDWVLYKLKEMGKDSIKGLQLDKDILIVGNQHYSPTTCCLVDGRINKFFTKREHLRGSYPLGVTWNKSKKKFASKCCDIENNSSKHLGTFTCPYEAHRAWQRHKAGIAKRLSATVNDSNVANALIRVHDQLMYQANIGEITVTF